VYEVEFTRSALKDLLRLPDPIATRIESVLQSLGSDPRPRGCRKLRDRGDLHRLRVGHYRIVYTIDDSADLVTVMRIRHRRDIYRGL